MHVYLAKNKRQPILKPFTHVFSYNPFHFRFSMLTELHSIKTSVVGSAKMTIFPTA